MLIYVIVVGRTAFSNVKIKIMNFHGKPTKSRLA
jgi:hypothetical protein